MKFNREQLAAALAVVILIIGAREIVLGVFAPTGKVLPVDPEISRSRREVVPRSYRTFASDDRLARNPFVFSEGWQPLDVLPMSLPPLPPAARPRPRPLLGAGGLDSGVLFVERAATRSSAGDGEAEGPSRAKEGG